MAEACWKCGDTEAETYRYCSHKKAFVCLNCERSCSQYSRKMLPNGTNCRLTYTYPSGKLFSFVTSSDDVETARKKYIQFDNATLKLRYNNMLRAHNTSNNAETRAKLRVELAAIYSILEERRAG